MKKSSEISKCFATLMLYYFVLKNFKLLVLFVLFCFSTSLLSQNEKRASLEKTIRQISEAFDKKNNEILNQYIHPDNGVYLLLQEGKTAYWLHRGKICVSKDCVKDMNIPKPYQSLLLELQLDLEKDSVTNSIDYQKYTDQKQLHKLTHTIRRQKNNLNIKHQDLERIWQIERNSFRVVIPVSNKDSWATNFTFYLSYLNNNWYLSIFDFNN